MYHGSINKTDICKLNFWLSILKQDEMYNLHQFGDDYLVEYIL